MIYFDDHMFQPPTRFNSPTPACDARTEFQSPGEKGAMKMRDAWEKKRLLFSIPMCVCV